MRVLSSICLFILLNSSILQYASCVKTANSRQRRYLLFTPNTQFGVFSTVSIPLESQTLTSVAWFFEASYYNVANASYFDQLLGDIATVSRRKRNSAEMESFITRTSFYRFVEDMLEKHGYYGHCLLRLICENRLLHFCDNGLLGDILHLLLTPSTSTFEEDLPDVYYEAEYRGLDDDCDPYTLSCPKDPLSFFTMYL